MAINRQAYRVFQGKDTKQIYYDRRPAQPNHWFYEPEDYEGDVIWGYAYLSKEEAIEAAENDGELEVTEE